MINGRRQPSRDGTSRMTRECHVRICERLGVQFPGPTRPEQRSLWLSFMTGIGGVRTHGEPIEYVAAPRMTDFVLDRDGGGHHAGPASLYKVFSFRLLLGAPQS
jgi:hypothetical protein